MTIQLRELAELVDAKIVGDSNAECAGANPLDIVQADEITMLDDLGRSSALERSNALAVVTSELIACSQITQLIVDDPHQAFAKIVAHFRPPIAKLVCDQWIDSTATIDPTAHIHPTAVIGPNVVVGARTRIMPGVVVMARTVIGNDCLLYPNVTIYEYTEIGDCVTMHAGCVIGAHGFGYRLENGRHVVTSQLGYVVIESDVDLGAGVTIDRGTYGATRIGRGTKVDNQVMIAHNCQIGQHNLLCSQVGIAGSCTTGDYVILAGQVGLKDHIVLGDHVIIGAQAGVMDDCPGDQVYLGSPATPQRDQMQIMAVQRRLPEIRKEVKTLRRDVDEIKKHLDEPQQDNRAA